MSELRWVLLGLGVLVIGGVYLWGRGFVRLPALPRLRKEPAAPADAPDQGDTEAFTAPNERVEEPMSSSSAPARAQPLSTAERVVTVRFIPASEMSGERVVSALRAAGLRHGHYGIFHRFSDELRDQPLFSVANLTEPGSFDLTTLAETTIPGMSFFMVLPGVGDPVERFDLMVGTARSLAHELDAELHDEKGSSWSIQRERYVREEIIRYRHQLSKH
jgi:cell division protein ZipA